MTITEIRINTDKDCKRCGELGVLPNGFCMKCAADLVMNRGGEMKAILKVTEAKVQAKLDNEGTIHKVITIKASMPYEEKAFAFLGEHVEEVLDANIAPRQLELGMAEEGS